MVDFPPSDIGELEIGVGPIGVDSGPPYPPNPLPGSNAIGKFEIGVSPIGTIPPFNWWATVLSQYANSKTLTRLIQCFFDCIDQTHNFDDFFDLIWNVDTAQGYGLDVWGRIVGINRILHVASGEYFGFEEAGAFTFGEAPFYSGNQLTSNYELSDESYRTLILAKALANITDGSIPSINQLLLSIFPNRGNCYVTDGQKAAPYFGFEEAGNASGFDQAPFYSGQTFVTMSIQYVFEFDLTPVELAIVQSSGVLPKPTGVSASVLII